ncbi:MAG: EscU/YscU/HrcU family type III secretion system export apparatus switch protein [Jatrophihabitantaceae bacterium]
MSGGGGGGGDRTEKATPKRRKKARHDGQIGNTPELGAWLGMLVASFLVPRVATAVMSGATEALVRVGAVIRNPDAGQAIAMAGDAMSSAFTAVLPMVVVIALIGVASAAVQGGIWFSPKALKPQFKRLNPLSGLKRMFGPHGWWTLVKALLKTSALAAVVYLSVRRLIPNVYGSGSLPLSALVDICVSTALSVLRFAAVAGLIMAIADYAVVRRRNNKQLKMTKREIKDEYKSSEGDPQMRGMRRSRALAMARNRMMSDVPTADVVVVNPTHVAVALRYDPQRGAPRVVAKGSDHVAARIRALAEEHRVPMVRDVPLARTLHQTCEIGQEIPPDLYKAVATVLAFIMTLRRRGSAAGTHQVRTLAPAG